MKQLIRIIPILGIACEADAGNMDCKAPDARGVVREVAKQYPSELSKTDEHGDEGWWFLDRLVPALQKVDKRWGYNCKRGNCRDLSKDAIAYDCGGGVDGSSNVRVIDVVVGATGPNPRPGWLDVTQKGLDVGAIGRFQKERPGASKPAPKEPGKVFGKCGPYRGASSASCEAGTYHGHPPDTEAEWLWTCRSIPHDGRGVEREVPCSEVKWTSCECPEKE